MSGIRGAKVRIVGVASVVALLGLLAACAPPPNPPGTITRPTDPVVVTGSQVSSLLGVPVGDIVAFNYSVAGWTQVPVQVDQRKMVELNTIYHQPANTTGPVNTLVYADPQTWTGAGSGVLGSVDEIAFMAKDAGGAAPSFSEPAKVVHNTGVKVTTTDQQASGAVSFVYLFRQSGGLDPGAGRAPRELRLPSRLGRLQGDLSPGARSQPRELNRHDAVLLPSLQRPLAGRASGSPPGVEPADILDRHKALFAPGRLPRSEDTFDAPRARSSPTSTGRSGRSAATSAPTVVRTPSAPTSTIRGARTSSPT